MNRQIKFRVWKDNKLTYMEDYSSWGDFWDENDPSYEPNIVFQKSIGLIDINYKDIYEGDMVEGHRFEDKKKVIVKGSVEWHQPTCMFVIRADNGKTNWLNSLYDLMVVGNIFENKK